MSEGQFYRSRFAQIISWESFQLLQDKVYNAQSLPVTPMGVSQYFAGSKGANLITKLVLFWLKRDGVFCYRNSSQGTARKLKDGRVKFTPGSKYAKGQGDIFAAINGRATFIEIKAGRDWMSEAQRRFKANIEMSGGAYLVVRSFDDFLEQYNRLITTP
ncbi:MAG: hypothetical protein KAR19_12600 [Bacteroidales bacterium]|nr:hypothetical protein [Bacteroidales bacterium]